MDRPPRTNVFNKKFQKELDALGLLDKSTNREHNGDLVYPAEYLVECLIEDRTSE
jgi:hypothetical protein